MIGKREHILKGIVGENKKLYDVLKEYDAKVEIRGHKPVFAVEEAASARGCRPDEILKVIVLLDRQDHPLIAWVRGDKRLDLKKFAQNLGVEKIKLADKKLVKTITGFEVGAVPPFGHRKSVETVMDEEISRKEVVHCSTGLHTREMIKKVMDLIRIVNPIIADIARAKHLTLES